MQSVWRPVTLQGLEAVILLWVTEPVIDTSEEEISQVQGQWHHFQSWGISRIFFPSCWVEKCVLSSYYKVFYILFIYLVGRAYIPGIFAWFVLLFLFSFFFFSLLKRPDHPGGTSSLSRRQSSRGQPPQAQLALGPTTVSAKARAC